jgi:citrate synthase
LYPEGDPRAACLLAALKPPALIAEIIATVAKETGFAPNIDFAIAAMTFTFNLDRDAPFAIFAVGRSVGWLAHAIEQAATGSLIRPRARYVGPPPTLD